MECANCRKPTQSSRCTGCLSVNYCSTDCQRQNWKTHKSSCTLKGKIRQLVEYWDKSTDFSQTVNNLHAGLPKDRTLVIKVEKLDSIRNGKLRFFTTPGSSEAVVWIYGNEYREVRNYRSASADKIFGPEMDKVFKANFYNGGCALEGTLMSGAMVILPVLI